MRKIIALLTVALIFVVSLTSCNQGGNSVQNSNQNTESVYEKLEKMHFASDVNFKVSILTESNGKSLTSEYNVLEENGGKSITYTEESFSTFESVNGEFVIPESYKTVNTGASFVKNGTVTVTDGEPSSAELKNISSPSFAFDERYFSEAVDSGSRFAAKVTNPRAFLGADISALNMSVTVLYSDTISSVILTYNTESSASVTVTYTFEAEK